MKKLLIPIVMLSSMLLLDACSCESENERQKKAQAALEEEKNAQLETDKQAVKAEIDALIAATEGIKMAPFMTATEDGRFVLTEKEKMVKPDYLIHPSKLSSLTTLSQKYHVCAMMAVDMVIAKMYDMPKADMNEAMAKLLVDLNDDAFTMFASTPWHDLETASDAMVTLIQDEYAAGREDFYWEAVASSFIEQLYVITRNVDKFMPMFTDESVYNFTYNFVYLREGLLTLVSHNPEMESMYNVLAPLYVINAMTVEQFRDELLLLKEDIERSREYLLK